MDVTVGTPGVATTALGPTGGVGDGSAVRDAPGDGSGLPVALATAYGSRGPEFINTTGRIAATQTAPMTPMTARSTAPSGPGTRNAPIRTGLPIAAARMVSPPATINNAQRTGTTDVDTV